ncbi:hypothetical protein [Actinoallomurus acaciae]|uniref:Uncharacterized protein n=1 Tax=Actinoallomurus acaciae TaxID=502577 RepID=A0ABV5YEX3_9ACTN
MTEAIHAWCLVNGSWVEREDPVMAACEPYDGDVRAAVATLGYEAWCQVGELPSVPVSLTLYSRETPPLQFLLQLEGNAGNIVEHVFAETLPDAMELLARWTPIVRYGQGRGGDVRGHAEDGSRGTRESPGRPEPTSGRTRARRRPTMPHPVPSGSPSATDRLTTPAARPPEPPGPSLGAGGDSG